MAKEKIPKSDTTKAIEKSIADIKLQMENNEELFKKGGVEKNEIINEAKKLGYSDTEIEKLLKGEKLDEIIKPKEVYKADGVVDITNEKPVLVEKSEIEEINKKNGDNVSQNMTSKKIEERENEIAKKIKDIDKQEKDEVIAKREEEEYFKNLEKTNEEKITKEVKTSQQEELKAEISSGIGHLKKIKETESVITKEPKPVKQEKESITTKEPEPIKIEKTTENIELKNERVNKLKEKILGMFRKEEKTGNEGVEQEIKELGEKKMLSPEEIGKLEAVLLNAEKNRSVELATGSLSSRFKNGIINGLEKWESYGNGEKDVKGYAKKFTKMAINLVLIGAISSISVEKLAEAGIGTATALGGGATSYLGRKMAIGLGLGGIMEAGGGKIPDKVKKWMPLILGGASIGVATIFTGGAAGVAVGLSSLAGYAASKLVKEKFSKEQIAKREEKTKEEFTQAWKEIEKEHGGLNIDLIKFAEEEYQKILKKYENQRIWGKLLDGAKKLTVGALVSTVSLEASGFARDITNSQSEIKIQTGPETKIQPEPEVKPEIENKIEPKIEEIKEETKIEHNVNPNAIVHKGEGITQAFAAQIKADHELASKLGFTGDFDNKQDIAEFTKKLAVSTGYMDEGGNEIRVAEADKVAYELKMENGNIVVEEKTVGGEIVETHHAGDKFEENLEKSEYVKNPEIKTQNENIIDEKYAPPVQVNPETGIPIEENNFVPPQQINPILNTPVDSSYIFNETENNHIISEQISPIARESVNDSNTTTINAEKEQVSPNENLGEIKHMDFENSNNIISIRDNGSNLSMKFIYDQNHNVIDVNVGGTYYSTSPNPYVIESELQKLEAHTRIDAHSDIFKMTSEARFLDKLPHNTYEYKFLHEEVAKMQKEIINNYGNVLNSEKLVDSYHPTSNTPENLDTTHNLSPELLEKVNQNYESNIHHVFPDEESLQIWNSVKDSNELHPAEQFMSWDRPVNETFRPLILYMRVLREITGLEPIGKSILTPIPETPEEYIVRATQKAAEMGNLDKVKL